MLAIGLIVSGLRVLRSWGREERTGVSDLPSFLPLTLLLPNRISQNFVE